MNSTLHSIWVQWFGASLSLFLKQEQHGYDLDVTTDVVMHVMSIQLQIVLRGNLSQLLQVLFDLLPNGWCLRLDSVSESTDGILWVLTMISKLLYKRTYEAWIISLNDVSYLLLWINIRTLDFSSSACGFIFFSKLSDASLYHFVHSCTVTIKIFTCLIFLIKYFLYCYKPCK